MRQGIEKRLWEMFAYVARYGHQAVSESKRMTISGLITLCNELSAIVRSEGPRDG